jgi:hypothetical protein
MTRKELEDAVWKRTHRDFRGSGRGSHRTILVHDPRTGGVRLVELGWLSDEDLRSLLPTSQRQVGRPTRTW